MDDAVTGLAERLSKGESITDPAEREAAAMLGGRVGIRKDAGGALIVAWFLPEELATELYAGDGYPGAVAPEDMHVTLLYLGDPEAYDTELVAATVKIFTQWERGFPGLISGQGRFVGDPDSDIVFATVDCQEFERIRCRIKEQLGCNGGLNWAEYEKSEAHGFYPHVTVAYPPKAHDLPPAPAEAIEFEVHGVTVAAAGQRADFNFAATLDSQAYETMDYAAPYYASRAVDGLELIQKAGKVISASNMKKLKDAITAIQALIAAGGGDPELAKAWSEASDLDYAVQKADPELRYTFGPLYAPERLDAHGEYADAADLQKALWEYVRASGADRRINLQHEDSGESTVGEWVEAVAWPYETTVTIAKSGEEPRDVTLPAGTVYMGVVWDPKAWDEGIKKGRLNGLSLGGRALRVAEPAPPSDPMGDMAKAAAAKMDEHTYGGTAVKCSVCGMGMAEGNHSDAAAKEAEIVAQTATAALEGERSLVKRLVDTLRAAVENPAADVHVHVPEQTIKISSDDVEVSEQ